MYSYKFKTAEDMKPYHTNIGENTPAGYISFDGNPIDWSQFNYIDGNLVPIDLVSEPETEPYVPTLDQLIQDLRAAINAERDRREQGGFNYLGKTFDSDQTSVIRINAAVNTAVAAILTSTAFSVDWTCADNTTITLDAQQFLGLAAALAQHSDIQHVRARGMKEQLERAETVEAVTEVESLLEAWKQEP